MIGQDGSSFAPASTATLDYMRRYTAGFNGNPAGPAYDWRTIEEYLACFDRRVAINVAYLIPNGNVRMEVMGLDPGLLATTRFAPCRSWCARGWTPGLSGFRRGSTISPAATPMPQRSPRLCEPIVAENGVYVTHMRGYGPQGTCRHARGV